MKEKTYKWPEAFDMMVLQRKRMYIPGVVDEVYFDRNACVFLMGNGCQFDMSKRQDYLWEEYKETVEFKWRTDKPPIDIKIILFLEGWGKSTLGYCRVRPTGEIFVELSCCGDVLNTIGIEKWSYIPE